MPKFLSAGSPPSGEINKLEFSRFRGVDLTSRAVNVSPARSPDAPNIMPDADGFPTKRPGWQVQEKYLSTIHGVHCFTKNGETQRLVHAGTVLWRGKEPIYLYMAKGTSTSVQLLGKLWILDGASYLCYNGETVVPVSDIATVPLITIAKAPNGENAATSYRPINLLTGKKTDSFLGTETDKDYFLSFNDLSAAVLDVQVLTLSGSWRDMHETYDYTLNRALGKVSFLTPPGKGKVTGEDNVRITYQTKTSGAAKINKCRFSILYGVGGALDRVFLGGNPDFKNYDYWSEWNDPAYIGDTFYSVLGSEASGLVGYSVVNDMLIAHKQNEENGRNIFVRTGALKEDGFAVFPIEQILQGEGALAPRSFATLNGEPMFLTSRGVYTLTPGDVTGERYVQGRSYFINGGLLKEPNLEKACAVTWGRFYVLSAGNRLYLLDGEQKSYEEKSPYSTFQYEGYYWTNISATCVWVEGKTLYFANDSGEVCAFGVAGISSSYQDKDKAVACHWSTPLLNLGSWSRYKTVTGVWVVGQPYARSTGRIFYATDREYEKHIKDYEVDIFSWDDINFNRWTFNTLNRPAITASTKKAKRVKLFQIKVANNQPQEAFGLFAVHIEYKKGGRIRQ